MRDVIKDMIEGMRIIIFNKGGPVGIVVLIVSSGMEIVDIDYVIEIDTKRAVSGL